MKLAAGEGKDRSGGESMAMGERMDASRREREWMPAGDGERMDASRRENAGYERKAVGEIPASAERERECMLAAGGLGPARFGVIGGLFKNI